MHLESTNRDLLVEIIVVVSIFVILATLGAAGWYDDGDPLEPVAITYDSNAAPADASSR